MSKNRVGFTVRLNIEGQKQMAMMCDFFDKDPKEITKLALQQLYIATGQISKKLTQEENKKEDSTCDTPSQEPSLDLE